MLRREVNACPPQPQDAICEAVGEAVSDALAEGHFADRLRQAGWALVHVGDHTPSAPPTAWIDDALNLMDPGWREPLALIHELWCAAWTAGYQVGTDAAEMRKP